MPPQTDAPDAPAAPAAPDAPRIEIRRPEALRWLLIAVAAGLAAGCLFVAFAALGRSALTVGLMIAFAALTAALARALILSDAAAVAFDGERLFDDAGAELCRIEDVIEVQRGFAFLKPSSGFVLLLTAARPRAWAPGLWWRFGRRLGVGGATPSRAGKAMADAITVSLAARARPPSRTPNSGA